MIQQRVTKGWDQGIPLLQEGGAGPSEMTAELRQEG